MHLQAFLLELGATIVDPAGEYYDDYYAVFFLDPDGLKLEGMKYGERHAREARRKRSARNDVASPRSVYARLPFFYGWVIVAVVFVTMGVAVNARTAFSLLFPPILDEFGWERGTTAGAFSFGFIVSAIMSPSLGRLMDRRGPLVVNELGVVLIGSGLLLGDAGAAAMAALRDAWHAGRRRQRLPGLHRPGTVPAQLVRPPPRPGDEPGVLRSRRGLGHPAAVAAEP